MQLIPFTKPYSDRKRFPFSSKILYRQQHVYKTKQFLPVNQDSPASPWVPGPLQPCPDILAYVHLELYVPLQFQIAKLDISEMFSLILICLTHHVLESLFICIHLLVICSCSVDELVFLVYNCMTESKIGSSIPVLFICSPYPMAMCPELFISHS